jgi:hypothetical protein
MKKRIVPRRTDDPVQTVPEFNFTADQRRLILQTLTCECVDESKLIAGLEHCARKFLWLHNQYRSRWTQAEQNNALTKIGHHARALRSWLLDLDIGVELALTQAAVVPLDYLSDFSNRLEIIADGAARVLEIWQRKAGPRRNPAIDRIMPELKHLYEQHTGKIFSHNPKRKTRYLGQPQSPAGLYVCAFFRIVDPSITGTAICTAMARAVRTRLCTKKLKSSVPTTG